jgi:hypothetical protein
MRANVHENVIVMLCEVVAATIRHLREQSRSHMLPINLPMLISQSSVLLSLFTTYSLALSPIAFAASTTLWKIQGNSVIDLTTNYSAFSALDGGIKRVDYDNSNGSNGFWGAGNTVVTDFSGTYTHSFGGTITGLSAYDQQSAFIIVSSVPVPAAAWLFGSGFLGMIGIARHNNTV